MSRPTEMLAGTCGADIGMIVNALQTSNDKLTSLGQATSQFSSDDAALVFSGSLARGEFTKGSDLDWTLLLDGKSDPHHFALANEIRAALKGNGEKAPGVTGIFGNLSFSHEMLHQIGGEEDSNINTTRRVLLLLESVSTNEAVRRRVVRNILSRYVQEDVRPTGQPHKVPHFLLNDIIRFWRMMTVDYANKRRARQGLGWAIRNIKLRLSRKLTYAAGLAACVRCELFPSEALRNARETDGATGWAKDMQEHLDEFIRQPPLDMLSAFILEVGEKSKTDAAYNAGRKILVSYDKFLALIDDESKRQELDKVSSDATCPAFDEGRQLGHDFQEGLGELFFGSYESLSSAMQKYGVF